MGEKELIEKIDELGRHIRLLRGEISEVGDDGKNFRLLEKRIDEKIEAAKKEILDAIKEEH